MAFVLVARMTAKDGEQDRVAELIPQLVEASSAEPGNVHYIAHRDPEDPRVFLMYEQYRDKAAFEEHGQTEHFQTLGVGEIFPLMEIARAQFLRDVRVGLAERRLPPSGVGSTRRVRRRHARANCSPREGGPVGGGVGRIDGHYVRQSGPPRRRAGRGVARDARFAVRRALRRSRARSGRR